MKRSIHVDFFIDSNHELPLTFNCLSGLNLNDGTHVDHALISLPNWTLIVKATDGVPKCRKSYQGLSEGAKFCETLIFSLHARLHVDTYASKLVKIDHFTSSS